MANNILKLVPILQSSALVSDNFKFVKKKKKSFLKQGVKNVIALELIKETSNYT